MRNSLISFFLLMLLCRLQTLAPYSGGVENTEFAPDHGQPPAPHRRLLRMHATHADDDLGAPGSPDPSSDAPPLAINENVLARLTVDVSPQLLFERGDIVLTTLRWCTREPGQGDWKSHPLQPAMALRLHDHAGLGGLELLSGIPGGLGGALRGAGDPVLYIQHPDGVTTANDDESAMAADSAEARRLGFAARLCIHPRQVAAVHAALAPTAEERAWAERVVAAAGEGGAVQLDGRMVDRPVLLRAQRLLAAAR